MNSFHFRLFILSSLVFHPLTAGAQDSSARLAITVAAEGSDSPIPCRVHLWGSDGKPIRGGDLPFFRDHFVCPGFVNLELAPGEYTYEIERGPEYVAHSGSLRLLAGGTENVKVRLNRLVDMSASGWWPGDLHVHRAVEEIELLMKAEDLQVAPVITWWNDRNLWSERQVPETPLVQFDGDRFYHVMGGEDEREGGALMYFNLKTPLAISGASREHPSPMRYVREAHRRERVWIDIEKPFWWDVPIWLASGRADSIGLANNHMCRSQMYETEAWGKPRDAGRLPPPRGNGFWTQEIYYQILNCGLRIPPSAGSASGVLPNPVGYNRVYVHLEGGFDHDQWWEGLRAGRSFVSNGPMLRCRANNELPGHVFASSKGKEMEIRLEASVVSRDPISSIEIVRNGSVIRSIPPRGLKEAQELGTLKFEKSGWFLVRSIAKNPDTFRFASTAPFYVEIGNVKRHISKSSVQFFLDWVRERRERVKLEDAQERLDVLKDHDSAEEFWSNLLVEANAD